MVLVSRRAAEREVFRLLSMLFMADAAMDVDEGTGQGDAAWAAGEGDGLGGREGA